jgi:hypothetical protein
MFFVYVQNAKSVVSGDCLGGDHILQLSVLVTWLHFSKSITMMAYKVQCT